MKRKEFINQFKLIFTLIKHRVSGFNSSYVFIHSFVFLSVITINKMSLADNKLLFIYRSNQYIYEELQC